MSHEAGRLLEAGDRGGALRVSEDLVKLTRQAFGGRHPQHAMALSNLALLHDLSNDPWRSEALYREAAEAVADDHPVRGTILNNLASALFAQCRLSESAHAYSQAIEFLAARVAASDPDLLAAKRNLRRVENLLEQRLSGASDRNDALAAGIVVTVQKRLELPGTCTAS